LRRVRFNDVLGAVTALPCAQATSNHRMHADLHGTASLMIATELRFCINGAM
jgi:hypothetical protein